MVESTPPRSRIAPTTGAARRATRPRTTEGPLSQAIKVSLLNNYNYRTPRICGRTESPEIATIRSSVLSEGRTTVCERMC